LNRAAITAAIDDLAGDHLALAVGVGGNHQFGCLADRLFDDSELRRRRSLDFVAPLSGEDGKLFKRPAFVLIAVSFRRRGFDQMADAPGDDQASAAVAAVAALSGAQHTGDVLALRGLLAQIYPHGRLL
jgi:hypothetical protein